MDLLIVAVLFGAAGLAAGLLIERFRMEDSYRASVEGIQNALPPVESPQRLTHDQMERMKSNLCVHCGGSHSVACPRLKRVRFKADGLTPEEVEFWPDREWPKNHVLFPDEVEEISEPEVIEP